MRIVIRTTCSVVLATTLLVGGLACGSDKSSSSAFCGVVKKYEHLGENDSDLTPGTFQQALEKVMAELEAAAPPEIKDDVTYTFDAAKAQMFRPVGGTDSRPEANKSYDKDKVDAANKRLDSYIEEHCGIKADS